MQHTDRRGFLGRTAMAGASLAFPGMLGAGQEKSARGGWQPKPALSSVMFSQLKLGQFCALAQKLGFKGIDLWGPFGKCRHMYEATEMGAGAFRKMLDHHDLEIGAWTTYRTKGHDEGFAGFAEFIGACGGGIVVRESSYGRFGKENREESFRGFFGQLEPEIELARKHKVQLAIENHSDAILDTPESFETFTRLNPAPDVVGVGIAPYHLQKHKGDVDSVIRACGDQLLFFYAWQQAEGKSQLPGQGPADFTPWMQALAGIGYQHWMTPFMHGELPVDEMAVAVAKATGYLNTLKSQQ